MGTREELGRYIPIADFIAAINGKNCEVLIHDLNDLHHSICHIVNGHVTGRSIGGSITNYAVELLQRREYEVRDSITNYTTTTRDGKKILRSSTYFIKDHEEQVIGLLCVNMDITDLLRAQDTLGDLLVINPARKQEPVSPERFDGSIDDIVQEIIDAVVIDSGLKLVDSTIAEKRALIGRMETKGVFKFKGAVNTVANVLGVSTQTIYRYLQNMTKDGAGD